MPNSTQKKVKTSFTNTKNEKVTVYTDGTKTRVPVINNGKVDISGVKEDVKPFSSPSTSLRDLSVAFSGKATPEQLAEISTRNPSLTEAAASSKSTTLAGADFATYDPSDPKSYFKSNADTLRAQISELETKMANRETDRNTAYDEAGVFEDMQTLNSLKDELRTAQDREIEIPIEGRQKLRGQQATKTEFGQLTNPALEKNLIEQLASSRKVSRLTDVINTNIAVIDSKLKAEEEKQDFLYKEKAARLEAIEKSYADILTEEQKVALEDKKFEQSLLLESFKGENALRSDLIKEIAKRGVSGVQLQGLMDASIDELVSFNYSVTSPVRWSELSYEDAAMTLSPDEFKQYEAYKKAGAEEQAAADQSLAVGLTAKNTINILETLLNDKSGLSTSVGTSWFGRADFREGLITGIGSESTQFRAKAKQLLSQATLDKLLELKAAGGTLGAISEKELAILGNAATALNPVLDGNGNVTGRFAMKEEEFKTALETMRMASMKTYIASRIGKAAYQKAGYQNYDASDPEDYNAINNRYKELLSTSPAQTTNYADTELRNPVNINKALEGIRFEEGLRTEAYQDQTGTWTIGYGNTRINGRPVQPGDRITTAQAEALMRQSVVQEYTTFADKVQSNLTPNQFAALTSFEYNLGSGVWSTPTGSRILALVNSGKKDEAGRLMLQYNKSRNPATGQLETNRVLAQRRIREAQMLLS